jgi:membrane fusion protein (multidrug efflux system)
METSVSLSSERKRTLIYLAALAILIAGGAALGQRLGLIGGRPRTLEGARAGRAPAPEGTLAAEAEPAAAKAEEAGPGEGTDNKQGDKNAPIPVSVAVVGSGPISAYVSSTANLIPENEVKVLAEAEGRIDKLRVEEGDRIVAGQELAVLVREEATIDLRKAELKAANARLAYDRAVTMLGEKLTSQEEFDKIKLQKEVAEQELAEAHWRLEKRTIRAPFGGRVTERAIRPGQHVKPGETLFTVSDFDPLIARIFLPERDILGLREGREVRIRLKASEETRFQGRIRQISPVVDTSTGTVKVTVEAVAPPSEVRPGSFVTIDIVRETHPDAVLVPRESVVRELQDAYVFVARGEAAEKRPVTLGLEENGAFEALSGLRRGERVIVAGQGSLKDGSRIRVLPSKEASDRDVSKDRPPRG